MITIKENNPWLKTPFFAGADAFTLGNTIRFKREVKDYKPQLFWHEMCHVCQYRKHGIVKFLFVYFIKDLFKSYRNKRFEIEAYSVESKQDLLRFYPEYRNLINEAEKVLNKYT